MSFVSLLRKEIHWSRRNALVLVFLLVFVPVFFAGTSLLFQDALPRNVPIAVTPADDNVTDSDLEAVEQTLSGVTNPRVVPDRAEASRQLERESVYGVVRVPPDIRTANATATVTMTVDGSVVPFRSPAGVLLSILEFQLDQVLDADISADREIIGDSKELPEYLLPSFLMTLTIFIAFTYVPYLLRREATVLDRVRVEASLESLVLAKLVYLTALLCVPVLVFHAGATYYGYAVNLADPGAVLVLLLTFFLLGTVSATVTVLSRFNGIGTFVNLVAMLGLLALSALAFPLGFYSTVRTTIAQVLPTHYAMIMVRSMMLKGSGTGLFLDWIGLLVGLCLLALLALKGAIIHFRRTT